MKSKTTLRWLARATLLLAAIIFPPSAARAQGTAFTYQGRLNTASGPVSGSYDLTFTLFNTNVTGSAVAGTLTNTATAISNGLFTVTLDFGGTPYLSGAPLWLEIAARTNGAASFSPPLAPRQEVTSAPYATYAYSVNASSLIGQVTDANLSATFNSPHAFNNPGNSFTGNGSGLTGLNATNLTAGTLSDLRLSTNVALRAGGNAFTGSQSINGALQLVGRDGGASVIIEPTNGVAGWDVALDYNGFHGLFFSQENVNFYNLVLADNGNVGINTPNPAATLEVNGSAQIDGTITASAFSGNGSRLSSLNATNLTAGALADSRLSTNVALRAGGNAFTGGQSINGALQLVGRDGMSSLIIEPTNGVAGWNLALDYNGFQGLFFSRENANFYNLVLADNGNVGINTPTPANQLEVQGSADFTGNVGIGTATPKHKLDVAGNIWLGTQQEGAVFTELGDTLYLGSPRKYLGNTLGSPVAGNTDWINLMAHPLSAGIMFGLSGPSDADPHSVPVPLMVIQSDGNVGIGTATPAATLEVNGTAKIDGNVGIGTTASQYNLSVANGMNVDQNGLNIGNVQSNALVFGPNSFEGIASKRTSGGSQYDLELYTFGANRLEILHNGDVGIGTTNPVKLLELSGSAPAVAAGASIDPSILFRLDNTAGDGSTSSPDFAGIGFGQNSTRQAIVGGTFGNDYLDFYTGGLLTTPKMRIDFSGRVGIGTTTPSQALQVVGNIVASGTITGSSDRNIKTNFAVISPRDVLDRVAGLPITRWNYDADLGVAHIGPMAQDFYAAFNVGMDDRHISMVDADGVALAAIQGLNQKVEQKDAKIKELEARLEKLERLMNAGNGGAK